MLELHLDRAGRRRSPATMPGFLAGRSPRDKGLRYPADPPKVEEIIPVMRAAGGGAHGRRLRGLIVILWRAGLRVQEALALPRPISTRDAARCSSAATRADADARSAWTTGDGRNSNPGSSADSNSHRPVVLRHQRSDLWPALGNRGRPRATPANRCRGRRTSALRATPTPPRPRGRDGPRRRPADRHPTPTRTQQPRHHLRLPPRHRQRRDHRHRQRSTRTDDPVSASLRL
jgi:hypothetical protein